MTTRLSQEVFSNAVNALPLVSVDFCLTDAAGRLLLGRRNNAPAKGWWFTPGGRIRKNEALREALSRVADEELGLPPAALSRAVLMGAWDHFYSDSAFAADISTHYVNLPHRLPLSESEISALRLPQGAGQQHACWQWLPLSQAAQEASVHPYVQVYARWLLEPGRDCAAFP